MAKTKNGNRYVASCCICNYSSDLGKSPLVAGLAFIGHQDKMHPNATGIVGIIKRVNINGVL
jgi:hypothetical protein